MYRMKIRNGVYLDLRNSVMISPPIESPIWPWLKFWIPLIHVNLCFGTIFWRKRTFRSLFPYVAFRGIPWASSFHRPDRRHEICLMRLRIDMRASPTLTSSLAFSSYHVISVAPAHPLPSSTFSLAHTSPHTTKHTKSPLSFGCPWWPVSYTHLTLPTIYSV